MNQTKMVAPVDLGSQPKLKQEQLFLKDCVTLSSDSVNGSLTAIYMEKKLGYNIR